MKAPISLDSEIGAIREKISIVVQSLGTRGLSAKRRKEIEAQLRAFVTELEGALGLLDPIALPTAVFDPSNPKVVGRFTALALVAQPRHSLDSLGKFYGSGVYAIYYTGPFPIYSPISGTETPIYVGKASPAAQGVQTARDQGPRLAARLHEHRKNIEKAATTLQIEDFHARFLVVQSGWEATAESYLIHLFRPIWNNETDILYGLGKHGDLAETRANKRSPWDTLHPGRKWAKRTKEEARSIARIKADVAAHFLLHPPVTDTAQLLQIFFDELRIG